jgi:hypothetical protein
MRIISCLLLVECDYFPLVIILKRILRKKKASQRRDDRELLMAKLKDIANIKIEHRNEKKLRELLEERGLGKKNSKHNKKSNPIIKTNYKAPKKQEENESK